MNLREDKHYSYGVFAVLPSARGQRPYISISAVQTDKTKESMIELVKEYNDIVGSKPITEEELKDEQTNATLALPGTFETVQQLAGAYGTILQYGLPEDYFNTFTQKAMAQTTESANEIAKPMPTSVRGWMNRISQPTIIIDTSVPTPREPSRKPAVMIG